jgi:hypothetical protein
LTLATNATITTPLSDTVDGIKMIKIFLNNAMSTVVFFLVILSVQLIYSLMLSDVEEKTY